MQFECQFNTQTCNKIYEKKCVKAITAGHGLTKKLAGQFGLIGISLITVQRQIMHGEIKISFTSNKNIVGPEETFL